MVLLISQCGAFFWPMIYGPSLVKLFDGIVAKTQQAQVFEVDIKHNCGQLPNGGDRQWGELPMEGIPKGRTPHGGAPTFSLFLEV